jgi:GNAT superfamily N-acetyltransferase
VPFHPDHERRGIGRALLAPTCNLLSEHGHKTAWLTTEPNTRAERFYLSDGWSEIRRDADGQIVFEKRL